MPAVNQPDDPPSLQWVLGGWAAIKAWAGAQLCSGWGGVALLLVFWMGKVCKVVVCLGWGFLNYFCNLSFTDLG